MAHFFRWFPKMEKMGPANFLDYRREYSRMVLGQVVKLLPLICLLVFAMTPLGREGFGEIVKAEIMSGTYDMQEDGRTWIEAMGRQNGVLVRFNCLWVGGRPVVITKWAVQGVT